MRRIYLAILPLLGVGLMLVLSACGGPTVPGAPSTTKLTSTAASQMVTMGTYGNDLLAGMMSPGSHGFAILSVGAKALGISDVQPLATSCNDVWTGKDTRDQDADGVRKDASITYTCSYSYGGTTMAMSGGITEKDSSDTNPNSGYEIHVNNLKFTMTGSGSTLTMSENGDFVMTTTSNGGYTANFNLTLSFDDGQGSAMTIKWSGNPTYTPDAGMGLDAGTFKFDGNLSFDDGAGNAYSLTYKTGTNGLHYDSTCNGGAGDFNSGSIGYSDGTNQVTLNYLDCGTGTYTFSGGGSGSF